ncbi:D-alanyl-D-alanine endopeptidase [Marinobacter halophilus]|uniref:D-alanyl-D-alanine endopeptidase n=1 Tax=Marinobacter halophilus TaxID=1323740 RepID=UPI001666EF8C|nr:D-alanyl-D-alanine endopeptidase [Marinobacter halophilus]GGC64183.1 D-alanyl-D-alanine endopeptidase [Marinobacter halophilus]
MLSIKRLFTSPWLLAVVFSMVSTGIQATNAAKPALASVNAAAAIAGEDALLFGKNADRSVPIASITKLMTALVVVESGLDMTEWLTFEERHLPAAANAWTRIRVDSRLQRRDVLRIALMSSENFAAYTLARSFPGGFDGFVDAMNAKARELGMNNTHFVDPTGLSIDNVSSASDLVRLANAAMRHPVIGEFSTTGYYRAQFRNPRYSLSFGNTNALVHRESWGVGLSKTGYLSDAGRCLIMVSQMDEKPVITVLLDSLGTRSPMGDAGRIKRWLATGASGSVAAAAKRYAQEKDAAWMATERGQTARINQ